MLKHSSPYTRRNFINTGIKLGGAAAFINLPLPSNAYQPLITRNNFTVQDIINIILKEIPAHNSGDTVDTIKTGDKDAKVTGVVTTMFPSIAVIKKAIQLKANFIIAHEPTFYNHADSLSWVNNNEVQEKKLQLLNENKITVWRAHDSWHAIHPDGISYGMLKKLQWLRYYKKEERTLTLPPTSLKNIIQHCKSRLGIKQVRVIGDAHQLCKKVAILPGAWGGYEQITTIINDKPDLIIVGELSEWETAEYVRDARALGSNIALIILGHAVSEEPGMDWMAEWLQPKVPGVIVRHVASTDPFTWV